MRKGGRVYRVERSFDPDVVKILDDVTGEDLTRQFSQDSRKEYDFSERHLGLSQKEFRNTIWIGQLGSAQEPGLGTEIQGKLESILEGGAEDVSLTRALSALADEKAKLKQPRSTKARLDLIAQEIDRLEKELAAAQVREEQVREWLIEASQLAREKARLEMEVERGSRNLREAGTVYSVGSSNPRLNWRPRQPLKRSACEAWSGRGVFPRELRSRMRP
jgi:hypothetical protein